MKTIAELVDLTGQVAIVTGGAKGIGRGICLRLAEAGAATVVADLDFAAAQETAQEILDAGRRARAMKVDVSSEVDIEAMIRTCAEDLGRIDVLVNNAGIYPSVPIAQLSTEIFDSVLAVNLRSVFLATRCVAEVMKHQGGGRIINVTSIDALHPSMVGLAHYDASKHGAWGFTKNAALELAPYRIWVNAIAPGGVQTPGTTGQLGPAAVSSEVIDAFTAKIPMGRMGDPDEIATVALFLASELSTYLTGSQIVVDGGALLT